MSNTVEIDSMTLATLIDATRSPRRHATGHYRDELTEAIQSGEDALNRDELIDSARLQHRFDEREALAIRCPDFEVAMEVTQAIHEDVDGVFRTEQYPETDDEVGEVTSVVVSAMGLHWNRQLGWYGSDPSETVITWEVLR